MLQTNLANAPVSSARKWTGRVLTGLIVLFFLMGSVMTLRKTPDVIKGTTEYGYPESAIRPMGSALLVGTLLYAFPPTAVLGAIVLTGYLGGAVATHVRASDPMFQIVFPAIFGAVLWGTLVLRDNRLLALLPWRRD